MENIIYKKYLKYKNKYLQFKKISGGKKIIVNLHINGIDNKFVATQIENEEHIITLDELPISLYQNIKIQIQKKILEIYDINIPLQNIIIGSYSYQSPLIHDIDHGRINDVEQGASIYKISVNYPPLSEKINMSRHEKARGIFEFIMSQPPEILYKIIQYLEPEYLPEIRKALGHIDEGDINKQKIDLLIKLKIREYVMINSPSYKLYDKMDDEFMSFFYDKQDVLFEILDKLSNHKRNENILIIVMKFMAHCIESDMNEMFEKLYTKYYNIIVKQLKSNTMLDVEVAKKTIEFIVYNIGSKKKVNLYHIRNKLIELYNSLSHQL